MKNIYINNDTSDDASMRWRNTVLGIDLGEGYIIPFMVERNITVVASEKKYLMEGHRENGGMWKPHLLDTSKVKNIIPFAATGYFNINNCIFNYISRYASTTTRKGMLNEHFSAPLNSMKIKETKKITTSTIYRSAYNPVYLDKNTIINLIMSGKALGLALSPNLAIALSVFSKYLRIYRNKQLLAEYDVKTNTTIIHKKLEVFKKELQEYGFDKFKEV